MSDLVFVDAPDTGFSRIAGKDKEKAFYGVDQDAWAFGDFISQFLSRYGRWNSPKYLFGESYGTTRSAVLSNLLQTDARRAVELDPLSFWANRLLGSALYYSGRYDEALDALKRL